MNFKSFQESKTGTLKKLEKASALSASEKPEDQDRAREYRVAADFKSWRNQKRSGKLKEGGIPKQSKPNEPYDGGKPVEEEVGISSAAAMEKARQEAKLRKKEQDAVRKEKEALKKEEVQLERALDTFEKGEKERIVKGMKKSSKDLKNRYGKDWKSVMYATATKKAKEEGDTSKSDKRYAYESKWVEESDQAFKNVVSFLQKKHGKDGVITKDNPPKPPTEEQKKAAAKRRAEIASQDKRDQREKETQGRYSSKYSNVGSD